MLRCAQETVNDRCNIKTLSLDELRERVLALGLKPYRSTQIYSWIYRLQASAFERMTNIAKEDRLRLAGHFSIPSIRLVRTERSSDGTRKHLFLLPDNHTIETVLIPDEKRQTLCISSQVGCQQACRFCLTGSGGFIRNLAAWEIADQVLESSRLLRNESDAEVTNIVLMGMGEPLANYEEVIRALAVITGPQALAFSPRRITLSTDGLVPEIDRLARSGLAVNLAISLNATTDAVRDRIMPVNRRYPLAELLAACRRFPLPPRRRITFEYVLLRGVNDALEDARRLTKLLAGIRCKVNLIPFNPVPGIGFDRPDDNDVRAFQKALLARHFTAPVRESRGRDISAACGQLREHAAAEEAVRARR